MTTNWPPIPDAAIEAAEDAYSEGFPLTSKIAITQEERMAIRRILRAAAPHLVGELVDILRHFDKLFPGSLGCTAPVQNPDGALEQCGSCWECALGYTLQRARDALRTWRPQVSDPTPVPYGKYKATIHEVEHQAGNDPLDLEALKERAKEHKNTAWAHLSKNGLWAMLTNYKVALDRAIEIAEKWKRQFQEAVDAALAVQSRLAQERDQARQDVLMLRDAMQGHACQYSWDEAHTKLCRMCPAIEATAHYESLETPSD